MTEGGHPTAQGARDLGLTPNLLRRWKQEVAGDSVAAAIVRTWKPLVTRPSCPLRIPPTIRLPVSYSRLDPNHPPDILARGGSGPMQSIWLFIVRT